MMCKSCGLSTGVTPEELTVKVVRGTRIERARKYRTWEDIQEQHRRFDEGRQKDKERKQKSGEKHQQIHRLADGGR